MKKKGNKLVFTRFEKLMFFFTILLVVLFPVMSVYAKSMLSKVNYDVEEAKDEIKKQEKSNESLQMKINELASLDNALEVADTFGLEYNNRNIRIITK